MRENRSTITAGSPALPSLDCLGVRHPFAIGFCGQKFTIEAVGSKRSQGSLFVVGLRERFALGTDPQLLHESHHALARALRTRELSAPRECADCRAELAVLQEDLLDLGFEPGIFSLVLARFPLAPGVIAADRNIQKRLAQQRQLLVPADCAQQ